YILRRMVFMIPLFIGITILGFGLISISPYDAVDIETQGTQLTIVDKMEMKVVYGLVTAEILQSSNGNGYWGTCGSYSGVPEVAQLTTPTDLSLYSPFIQGSLTNESWQDETTQGETVSTSNDGDYVFAYFKFKLQAFQALQWFQHAPGIRVNVTALSTSNGALGGWQIYFSHNMSNIITWNRQTTEALSGELTDMSFKQPYIGYATRDFILKENGVDTFSILIVSRVTQTGGTPVELRIDDLLVTGKIFHPVPPWIQYFNWLGKFLLGQDYSFIENQPVLPTILVYGGETAKLILAALLFSLIIGIPAGIITASEENSLLDKVVRIAGVTVLSLPLFLIGLILLLDFSIYFPILPYGGAYPITGDPSNVLEYYIIEGIRHLILPSITIGLFGAALITRIVRFVTIELQYQNPSLIDSSMSLTERINQYIAALKSAFVPLIIVSGLSVGMYLFEWAFIVEGIFNWPGIFRILLEALIRADLYLALGILVVSSVLLLLATLLIDFGYALLDPEMRVAFLNYSLLDPRIRYTCLPGSDSFSLGGVKEND
ncbi:MAG: ABC transporter permease, partial [Promethearchaeota archaeon]